MKEETQKKIEKMLMKTKTDMIRFRKMLRWRIRRFFRWKYGTTFVLVFLLVMSVSLATGCLIGERRAEKAAKEQEKKLSAEYRKEKAKLEDQIKQIQREEPKARPWNLTLVNDTHPMPEGYVPKLAPLDSENSVDERILQPLKQMLEDAKKAGLSMYVCSSYRSVERQKELYDLYMGNAVKAGKSYWEALEETKRSTAYPGRSEHGMGLAVDIISNKYTALDAKQQETAEAKWLMANCHKYGFILRYPIDKTEITDIIYEPWHYRYVGVEDAEKIVEQGVTLEEYLGEVH